MSTSRWRGHTEWVTLVAVIFTAGYVAQAGEKDAAQDEAAAMVVDDDNGDKEEQEVGVPMAFGMPSHFLGIHGLNVDPILAKHLGLEEGIGVLVKIVLDDSPAEKAGLEKDDILLAADGKELSKLEDLVEIIRDGNGKEISLDLIREGKRMTLIVKPAKRPNDFRRVIGGPMPHSPHALRLRTLGPGGIMGGMGRPFDLKRMPGNLSVSITRNNDEPAKIKIKQGDKTWEFNADDEKAIEKLPDGVREFIEPMLGNVGMFDVEVGGFPGMPLPHGMPPGLELENMSNLDGELSEPFEKMMERIEEMEARFEELRDEIRRMHDEEDKN